MSCELSLSVNPRLASSGYETDIGGYSTWSGLIGSNRLVGSCHKKCIAPDDAHRYHEGELLKGEAVCIDRCTSKFFEVRYCILWEEECQS